MSQASTVIQNTGTLSGLSMVNAINAALDCLLTNNSGATAPAQAPIAYQFWADTTKKTLMAYLGSSWIPKLNMNTYTFQSKTANYTLVAADFGTAINATGANSWTLTLTAAATLGDGFAFDIVNSGTGVITVDPNASETIDGATTILVYPGQACSVLGNGTAWSTVGRGSGKHTMPVSAKTAAYTVVAADIGTMFQATANTWTLTLTAAATLGVGFIFGVQNTGAGIITVDPNASETINGATTLAVNPGESRLIICDGAAWRSIASDGINSLAILAQAKTATYTVTTADRSNSIKFSGLSADVTCNLPSASSAGSGFVVCISNEDTGADPFYAVTVDPSGAELIDGATTRKAFTGTRVILQCDGTGWRTIAGEWVVLTPRQTVASAGNGNIAHGQPYAPRRVWCFIVCVTAELNYSVGDVVYQWNQDTSTAAVASGASFGGDATNLFYSMGSNASSPIGRIFNKTTGAAASPTNANWKMVVGASF